MAPDVLPDRIGNHPWTFGLLTPIPKGSQADPLRVDFKEADQIKVFEWKQDGALLVTGAGYALPSSAIRPGHEPLVSPR